MTDPFSVAAGTAGLISLGIEVSQSLVKFYTTYKHIDSDIDRTLQNSESLHIILETLQKSISARKYNKDNRDLVATIESRVKTCEESIQELQGEYNKLSKQSWSRDEIKAAIKSARRRAVYPIRQSTLQKLGEDLDEIKSNLTLALGVLGIAENSKIQNDLADVKTTLDLLKSHQISSELESWLTAPDATIDHNNACSKKHQGTGIWLVKDPRFKQWLTDGNSFMWLNGFAGSGKSVLCSTAIQSVVRHRGTDRSIGVAFFYFKFNDESKKDDSSMLRALLLQLSHQMQDGHVDLLQLQQTYRSGTPPPQALISYLRRLIERFRDVYIMLDALDESPGDGARGDVLNALETIRKWNLQGLHLFVTSRNESDIHECFDYMQNTCDGHITMRNQGIDTDIANFVSGYLDQNRSLQKWRKHHGKIQEGLATRANGVFRWVECQLKSLQTCPCSPAHLDRLLKSLPKSLDETYERMLCNIPTEQVGDARRILTLLCFVTRPLKVRELIDAIAVEIKEPIGLQEDLIVQDYNDINKICPGLLELIPSTDETDHFSGEYVQIAHFSVQEYLKSDRIREHKAAAFSLDSDAANAEIAQVCLVYLLERDLTTLICDEYSSDSDEGALHSDEGTLTSDDGSFDRDEGNFDRDEGTLDSDDGTFDRNEGVLDRDEGTLDSDDGTFDRDEGIIGRDEFNLDKLFERYPLAAFAAASWPQHYKSLTECSSEVNDLVSKLLHQNGKDINWLICHDHYRCGSVILRDIDELFEKAASSVYYASLLGLHDTLREWFDACSMGDEQDQAEVPFSMPKLLEMTNAEGGAYGYPLVVASARGHYKIVQLLLGKDANVDACGEVGTALYAASFEGEEEIVRLLLNKRADVNFQGGDFGNALQSASFHGSKGIVQLLLENGADINVQGGRLGTALQAASFTGDKETVQLLLSNGADVNVQGGFFGNALQSASFHRRKGIVQLLLENGADINVQGGHFGTALQAASFHGSKGIIQLLLENGADINVQGGLYGNALQAASLHWSKGTVQLLLENGADVNAQGGMYGNALQAASAGGHSEEVVQLLLENGADVNAQGGMYGNALQAASSNGSNMDFVQLLLENGADINAQGGKHGNALQAATSASGSKEIVQLLLEKGADVNAQGGEHGNALNAARKSDPFGYRPVSREEIIQLLRDNGAVEQ